MVLMGTSEEANHLVAGFEDTFACAFFWMVSVGSQRSGC